MTKDNLTPPYLPFRSFLTALDQLAQATPNVITKDVFPNHSGLLQGQVISALRFFGLIDRNGIPTGPVLEKLASENEVAERRANLRPILKSAYAEIMKLDLAKVTPSQLDAVFEMYGVNGDTKKKAKTFFINSAKFSELALSPLLMRKGRGPFSTRKKKPAIGQVPPAREVTDTSAHNGTPSTSKTIQLKRGVTLTVTAVGNLLDLEDRDRRLVFGIMDQINSHSKHKG